MTARSLALSALLVGCIVHTHEMPESSLTSTTQATNATAPAPYDPHFQVSGEIYESCQVASKTNMGVAEATAACMNSGALVGQKLLMSGSKKEVDDARERLLRSGVASDRIDVNYTSGPAQVARAR